MIASEAHDGAAGLDTGQVVILSGKDGSQLFYKEGLANERMGSVVRGGHDLNFDGSPDVLVTSIGSPPSAPGYARVFSGTTGALVHNLLPPPSGRPMEARPSSLAT